MLQKHKLIEFLTKTKSSWSPCEPRSSWYRPAAHLLSSDDVPTLQGVDVFKTLVREATDHSVVAEDDAGHLGDVLVALVVADVATMFHQTGHQVAFPQLLRSTFFNLSRDRNTSKLQQNNKYECWICY